jgi:hypothetical protein
MSNDPILDRLVKIRKEFERILIDEGYLPELPHEEREQARHVGLTSKEAKGWFKTEPDFTKRIVTPLNGNRRQTRRYQNRTSQCLNEPRNACDQNRDQELR